jgi:hypothetical protein
MRIPKVDLPGEIWVPIDRKAFPVVPEIEYEISNLGRMCRSFDSYYLAEGRPFKKLKVLRLSRGDEYIKAKMALVTGLKRIAVAHLVAHHFIGPRPDGLYVNHIDGDKLNNRAENLEYVTQSENLKHAFYVLGAFRGAKNGWTTQRQRYIETRHRKLTPDQVREIRARFGQESAIQLGRRMGVGRNIIYGIVKGLGHKHVA